MGSPGREKNLELEDIISLGRELEDPKVGIIKKLEENKRFTDEPSFYMVNSLICNTGVFCDYENLEDRSCTGKGVDKKIAFVKAIGESVERYCVAFYDRNSMIYDSYKNINRNSVNPEKFRNFSEKQLEKDYLKDSKFTNQDKFWWVKGKHLLSGEEVWIPSQIVYVPYIRKKEPFIRNSTTNGAAAETDYQSAVFNGICELVERESFMIFYLNKLRVNKIDLSSINDKEINKIINSSEKYNITINLLKLITDFPVDVFCSFAIDKTGKGPAVMCGINAHVNTKKAIKGAILESLQSRDWLRRKKMEKSIDIDELRENKNSVNSLLKRGLYWYDEKMIKELDFVLKQDSKDLEEFREISEREGFKKIMNFLEKKDFTPIVVDVTKEDIKSFGFKTVKVEIPELYPLYLMEKYKYLGNERLCKLPKDLGAINDIKTQEELNQVPHPFL